MDKRNSKEKKASKYGSTPGNLQAEVLLRSLEEANEPCRSASMDFLVVNKLMNELEGQLHPTEDSDESVARRISMKRSVVGHLDA